MHNFSISDPAHFSAVILIADDDPNVRSLFKMLFLKDGHHVIEASDGREAVDGFLRAAPDIVLLDVAMPVMDGLQACRRIRQSPQGGNTPILLITAYTDDASIQKGFEAGATDFIAKPVQTGVLRQRTLHLARARQSEKRLEALQKLEQVREYAAHREREECVLVGESPIFANIRELIRCAAAVTAPTLITGETGTGKSVAAKAIHHANRLRSGAFIGINCAALPETLIESELFGAERGAYTGSVAARRGAFELADGGTLFLDEIGEMPVGLQSKLLGALEDRKIRRIGSETTRDVDVRIIAATNAEPERAMNEGKLRRDLYYRLNVISIRLPPLRERREDIPVLCAYFLKTLAPNRETFISPAEMRALTEYDWPGNIREMRNVIERCLIVQGAESQLAPSKLLDVAAAARASPPLAADLAAAPAPDAAPSQPPQDIPTMDEVERRHIRDVFHRLHGNQTRTAKALDIPLTTLKRKLKRYGIRATHPSIGD
jgi:two-component system, NtrC family, response regulator AtoC